MNLKQIECPACGGTVSVPEDQDTCYCTYCGRQLAIEGRLIMIVKQTQVIEDKARLRELELQEEEHLRQEKREQERRKAEEEKEEAFRKKRGLWWGLWICSIVLFPLLNNNLTVISCLCLVTSIVFSAMFPVHNDQQIKRGWLWLGLYFASFLISYFLSAIFIPFQSI